MYTYIYLYIPIYVYTYIYMPIYIYTYAHAMAAPMPAPMCGGRGAVARVAGHEQSDESKRLPLLDCTQEGTLARPI